MRETNEVYTVGEVARRLKISPETLRRRICAGELEAIAFAGGLRKHHRITSRQLRTWLGDEVYAALFIQVEE
ncbi:helix-turn-helix domain-containing protein [Deinococcus aquaticus]|uniref:helix-turn-helix domain-containing protein n=1 Tax=Deinococcus aquaticus TaxID=328692 RepID=UPI003F44916F